MVELAETKSILDEWQSVGLVISDDVRGVQKLAVPQRANGALLLIGQQDSSAKLGLVKTEFGCSFGVGAFDRAQM
ncbi:Uncharacterised protein [Mycobacteroides abscessus subsp. abscessus]|nr:Uncharacterised protein [Mycobacteroides abscessus subsp. abscessus]